MEPITAAVVAALANISKEAISDGYQALKALLKRKFGEQSDVVVAAEKLEDDPDSEAWKAVLEEQAKTPEVAEDAEVRNAVNDLRAKLENAGISVQVTLSDSATAQGVIGAGKVEVGEMTFGSPKKD